jgi:hypothetical protein
LNSESVSDFMDPGTRNATLIGLLGGACVLAAAAFVAPLAPLLAAIAGPLAGWAYVRFTRRELTVRKGTGGVIAAPPIVAAQGVGTALNLLLLGGGYRLGARLTVIDGGTGELILPPAMIAALITLMVLFDLALVLVGAEWAGRRAAAARA